jgi:aspartyl aminopeptidase
MTDAKTELMFVAETISRAEAAGFEPLRADSELTPGARFYDNNRDRALALIVVGSDDLQDGFRIVGAHIDSPRLELKGRPLYGKEGFALFQTNYHGGIKNYQWTSIPLALVGRIDKKDGTTINVSVGNKPGEPVFIIPELSPHVDVSLRERKSREVIAPEELDPIVGHIPGEEETDVKDMIAAYLDTTYGVELDDLVSAELSLVPAYAPRDVGFDRGLMAIYGQDDRASGYAAVRAILDVRAPAKTSIAYLVDNEEVGNVNNTGAASTYLVDLMGRLLYTSMGDRYNEHFLRMARRATRVISSDVNPGINPLWPNAWEAGNAPRLGHGVNLKLYGRGFNANSEYIAWIRGVLDEEEIPWQVVTYKVGVGGGGTIGREMSDENMEVIDFGIPILSIHTPYSVSSKVDVYSLYRALHAFYVK